MRTRTALLAVALALPLAGLPGGTASAEPYLPPGKPVPATGVYAPDGATVAPAPRALPKRPVQRPVKRLAPRR